MYRIGLSPTPRGWQSQAQRDLENARRAAEEAAQAAAPPNDDEAQAPDPPPPREPAPADPPQPVPTQAGREEPEPESEPEPELHEVVAAWMRAHWDVVSAMARAKEAPARRVPPQDGEVAARSADGGGSSSGAACAAHPLHHAAHGPPPRPGEDVPPPYVAPGDRWTKWKMAEFLRQLAATQSVSAAAKAVGMGRQSAYKLRSRLKGQPFDIAWEAAFRHGFDNLAHSALELALEGEEVPHYYQGELVATHRKRNPQLIVQLLKMRNSAGAPMLGRYGAAAEYWSEAWERMTQRVETGSVTWHDEHAALPAEERAALGLPDERQRIDLLIERNGPDTPRGGSSRA